MTISLPRDANRVTVIGGTSSADGISPVTIYVDPNTHRMLVDASSGSGEITIGTTTITGGTTTRILYDNAGVVGEYPITGSGNVVLSTSPTLVTPTLGAATATTINKVTITAPATSSTITIADGKILTASNTLTFTGTDGSSVAFGTGGTVLYANQSITLSGDVTGSGTTGITTTVAKIAGTTVSGTTGSGNVVFSTSPTLVTPILGTPTSGNLTNCTFPTLNQNTSGTAANLSGTPALPNGTTATTQSANDNSTKLATTAYADAAGAGKYTLLHQGSGTSTNSSANDLDTYALSGLTLKDTLVVYANGFDSAGNCNITLRNITDGLTFTNTIIAATAASGAMTQVNVSADSQNNKRIFAWDVNGGLAGPTIFTTAWTGSWTLSFRSGGISGGGTLNWQWAVYKIAGQ